MWRIPPEAVQAARGVPAEDKRRGNEFMKKRIIRFCCGIMAAGLLVTGITFPVADKVNGNLSKTAVTVLAEDAVTVKNYDDFANALKKGKKNIIVAGRFTIRDENLVETEGALKGQMKPVEIPGGTVITGNGTGSISCSHPIQIMGDDVVIRDIELVFNSSDALGSVPHREIFLAGHSLVFDNVSTYLKGPDQPNAINGTEKELLPTVYAGGYHGNNTVGNNASFTVRNANKNTMFQAINLGHETSDGERTAYTGDANLELDADAKVRGEISAEHTASASITFLGEEDGVDEIRLTDLKGNADTRVTVKNCAVSEVTTTGIKNIVLDQGGRLQPKDQAAQLDNITLKNGGCLDLTQVSDALIKGDFTGDDSEANGKLVLGQSGYVQINGQVSGVTRFQVGNHVTPGNPLNEHTYIIAEHGAAGNFVLSKKDTDNGYSLIRKGETWTAYYNYQSSSDEISSIDVKTPRHKVYTKNIPSDVKQKTGETPYFEISWKDTDGNAYSSADAAYYGFYSNVVVIRSEDWKNSGQLSGTDWSNPVRLEVDEEETASERYYLVRSGENAEVKTGKYMFLFCSESLPAHLDTVEDVKNLGAAIKAEVEMDFSNEGHIHTPGTPVRENEIKATCQTIGSYEEVIYCADSDCGYEMSRETKTIPVLDHVEGLPVIENRVEATVNKAGSYDKVIYCKKCKVELRREKVEIPALKPEEPGTEDPTKPDTGKPGTEDPSKPDTGKPGTEDPSAPDTGKPGTETPSDSDNEKTEHKHSYVLQTTIEATCEKEGEKIYACTCGDRYTEKIAKKPHTSEKNLTPAKPGSDGNTVTKCSVCNTVLQQETINAPKTIKLSKERYVYDGKAKKPGVHVIDNEGQVISDSFYKISYQNNKNIGKATVTVKFQGNYTGTLKKTFEICPKGTSVTNIKSREKSFTLKWKKQTSQTSGYEIAYATDASFRKKSTKTVVIKSNKTMSKEVKGLKPGKKYYVKIRTYKEVKSGTKKVKIYSDWSKKKSVQIKK